MDDQFTVWRAFALAGQFGITLGIFVAGGIFLGEWLDAHFQTAPLFILVCVFAGLTVGTVSGIQLIRFSLRRGSN